MYVASTVQPVDEFAHQVSYVAGRRRRVYRLASRRVYDVVLDGAVLSRCGCPAAHTGYQAFVNPEYESLGDRSAVVQVGADEVEGVTIVEKFAGVVRVRSWNGLTRQEMCGLIDVKLRSLDVRRVMRLKNERPRAHGVDPLVGETRRFEETPCSLDLSQCGRDCIRNGKAWSERQTVSSPSITTLPRFERLRRRGARVDVASTCSRLRHYPKKVLRQAQHERNFKLSTNGALASARTFAPASSTGQALSLSEGDFCKTKGALTKTFTLSLSKGTFTRSFAPASSTGQAPALSHGRGGLAVRLANVDAGRHQRCTRPGPYRGYWIGVRQDEGESGYRIGVQQDEEESGSPIGVGEDGWGKHVADWPSPQPSPTGEGVFTGRLICRTSEPAPN